MSTRCPCSTQRRCSTSDTTTRFLCTHRHEHLVRCNLHCRRGNPGNRPSCHVASCSRLFITINLIPWHSQSQRSRGPAVTKDSRDNWFWFPVTYPTQRDSYALPRFHPLLFFASLPPPPLATTYSVSHNYREQRLWTHRTLLPFLAGPSSGQRYWRRDTRRQDVNINGTISQISLFNCPIPQNAPRWNRNVHIIDMWM